MGKDSLLQIALRYVERRPLDGIDGDEQKKFLDLARLHAALILDVTTDVADAVRLAAINSASRLLPLEYLSVFQKLDDILIEWLHNQPDPGVFHQQLDIARIPTSIKTLIFRCLHQDSNPVDVIRRIRQISAFPLRINLRGAESCIDKLLEINSTRNYRPSERLVEIVEGSVTLDFLSTFIDNIAPRHGNGSVAYVTENGNVKSSLLSLRQKDDLLDTSWLKSTFANTILSDSFRHYPDSSFHRPVSPSKVMSVPKTWKKQRIVAIEDVTRMYGEQAVRGGLYAALKHAFPGHIDFSNATVNQDMARFGSLTGAIATIDLSSASDSVGTEFVGACFERTPLWPIMDALRTQCFLIEEQGRTVQSSIFATMGNAICFPIMSWIFACVCLEVGCSMGDSNWAVYGDDICAPDRLIPDLVEKLQQYGFTVNVDKSFFGDSSFRESCGGEYVKGKDVTPLRISRKFEGIGVETPDNLAAEVDLYNRAYAEFPNMRNLLGASVSKDYTRHLAFSYDGSYGLISVDPKTAMKNYTRYWNESYQRAEYLVDSSRRKQKQKMRNQAIAYAEWLANADRVHANAPLNPRTLLYDPEEPYVTSAVMSNGRTIWQPHLFSLEMKSARCAKPAEMHAVARQEKVEDLRKHF